MTEDRAAEDSRNTCWETCKRYGYRQFVVADIDLLGQRGKLLELSRYDVLDMKRKETKDLQVGAFKAVACVRDALDGYLRDRESLVNLSGLSGEDAQVAKEMLEWPIGIQSHSDSLVYHICVESDANKPAAAILDLLWGGGAVMLPALAYRQPLRGGVEFHWAANLTESEIYGPAPYLAYCLESQGAGYPRIVVGDCLMGYLRDVASRAGGDLQGRIVRAFAQ